MKAIQSHFKRIVIDIVVAIDVRFSHKTVHSNLFLTKISPYQMVAFANCYFLIIILLISKKFAVPEHEEFLTVSYIISAIHPKSHPRVICFVKMITPALSEPLELLASM